MSCSEPHWAGRRERDTCQPFANYLRNILPNSDIAVMEMGAKAIGRLALAESALTAEYVEFEVRRALEWLSQEKHEHKRHAAVSGQGL